MSRKTDNDLSLISNGPWKNSQQLTVGESFEAFHDITDGENGKDLWHLLPHNIDGVLSHYPLAFLAKSGVA